MMTVIHILMLGFIVGAGLCALHYVARRWAEAYSFECPMGKLAYGVSRAGRLTAFGLGAYLLASVGWVALPAAATGFLVVRPALSGR